MPQRANLQPPTCGPSPQQEVLSFLSEPANDVHWRQSIIRVKRRTDGMGGRFPAAP